MRWLATIGLPASSRRRFAADAVWPAMRTQRHQVGGEGPVGAQQRLDRHRRRDVGRAEQHVEVGEREHEHAEHAVGAVDEGQAFLGLQRDRRDAGGGHLVGALALADQRQADVGQRREVATGAERAVLVHRSG